MNQINLKPLVILLSIILSLSANAHGSFQFERSIAETRDSVFEAVDRSRQDHIRLRNETTQANWERIEALNQRAEAAIVIQGTQPLGESKNPVAAQQHLNVQQVERVFVEPQSEAIDDDTLDYGIEDELRELSSL